MSIEGAHREEEMREEQEKNTSSKPSTLRSSNLEKKKISHTHRCWRLSREVKKIKTPILEGGYKAKNLEDDQNDMNEGAKINWWCIWNYQIAKKKGKVIVYTIKKNEGFEERIFYFWLDFFFVRISHIPTKTPHEKYCVILWN
jgi:hypothetical protein